MYISISFNYNLGEVYYEKRQRTVPYPKSVPFGIGSEKNKNNKK